MNRLKIFILGFVVLMATVNFTANDTKNTGIVNRNGDYYVFHLSVPANDYTVVNIIKLPGVVRDASVMGLYKNLCKRAEKEGIRFDGLIISDDMGSAEMIIYK